MAVTITNIYTTTFNETTTWTVPSNTIKIGVIAVGGGGGGGGGANGFYSPPRLFGAGGGGGGGGRGATISGFFTVTPGQSHNIFVGQGGSGGTVGANGANGTSSQVETFIADGGKYGQAGIGVGGGGGGGAGGDGRGLINVTGSTGLPGEPLSSTYIPYPGGFFVYSSGGFGGNSGGWMPGAVGNSSSGNGGSGGGGGASWGGDYPTGLSFEAASAGGGGGAFGVGVQSPGTPIAPAGGGGGGGRGGSKTTAGLGFAGSRGDNGRVYLFYSAIPNDTTEFPLPLFYSVDNTGTPTTTFDIATNIGKDPGGANTVSTGYGSIDAWSLAGGYADCQGNPAYIGFTGGGNAIVDTNLHYRYSKKQGIFQTTLRKPVFRNVRIA